MDKTFFSEASWLDRARLQKYATAFVVCYVVLFGVWVVLSPQLIDPNGKPLGTDFMNVWAAGKLVLSGDPAAAYDYARHYAVQKTALPWADGQDVPFYGWHYPPMFLLIAALLAALPYALAFALWMLGTLALYAKTIWKIFPERLALMVGLAFPAVFVNFGHGQNGFLTTALLGGGLFFLNTRPLLAGVLLGLLAYKPQFALLIPFALMGGQHWRTLLAAAGTVLVMAGLSWILLGDVTWQAFFNSMPLTRHVLEEGAIGWSKVQSVFSAVRMLGGDVASAYAAQALVGVVALVMTLRLWFQEKTAFEIKAAALALATLLMTPYVLDYDLVVLALPIAWLSVLGLRDGFLPWEKLTLLLVWWLPILSRPLGDHLHVQIAPVLLLVLFAILLRRASVEPAST